MVNATPPDAIDALDILSKIPADGAAATSLDTGPVSATADLYRAAIGLVNTDFYQRVFDRFEASERTGPTWNWAAALLTVNWLVFRQLWAAAVVYGGVVVAALIAVLGLGRLVFHWSSAVEIGLLVLLALLTVVVPGAFGNALLHANSRKKMAQALAANTTVPEACAMLERQASTKQRLIWIALVNALLVGAAVGLFIALPTADRLPLSTAAVTQVEAVATVPAASAPITVTSAPEVPASAPAETPAPAEHALTPEKPEISAAQTSTTTANASADSKAETNATASDAAPAKKIYINVGLFAKESNAHNAHDKLTKAGLPSKEQQVTGTKGTFTRVRVGPYKTMAQAEKAVEKIKGQGLDAVVVRQ